MRKIFLCDGHNLAFRAFYGIKELKRSDGFPTNMIHGWLKSFWRIEEDFSPNEIWVFFDLGGCHKRESILPEYKANRGAPPEGFLDQLNWVKKLSVAMGYGLVEENGREADDLIAAKAKQLTLEDEVVIVSADKDLGQLVGPNVSQLLPPPTANPKIGWRLLNSEGIEKKFGVSPDLVVDYLSLIGDQSDNIPGLSGVGPKTAVKWIKEWGNLEGIILNAGRISPKRFCSIVYEQKDVILRNRELIKLDEEPFNNHVEPSTPNLQEIKRILSAMEMRKSLEDAIERY